MTGTLFIISAASGTGKTSLIQAILKEMLNIKFSVSYTTRSTRAVEQEGVDYHFVSDEVFRAMIDRDEFLEHAEVFGCRYGTSKKAIEKDLAEGWDIVLEIDWQGAERIRKQMENQVSVFVLPPSRKILQERILARNMDAASDIEKRLKISSSEIQHYVDYDYLIVNDNFSRSKEDLKAIIRAKRCCRKKQSENLKTLLEELT